MKTEQGDEQVPVKDKRGLLADFWRSPFRKPVLWVVAGAFFAGWLISGFGGGSGAEVRDSEKPAEAVRQYTCSMHPQVKQPKMGKCPVCFMDLIPLAAESGVDDGKPILTLSRAAIELAEIQTALAERKFASASIFLTGKIEVDETRIGHITARVPGRIDRLYIDFTGIAVRKGDHLVSLFSPELISAQQELLQALNGSRNNLGTANLEAAKEKLLLWGLSKQQVQDILDRGTISNHLTVYSPMSGVVIEKHSTEGVYVETGTPLFTLADLSRLWVRLDAYEADLPWLRYGQKVTFEVEALPGEGFSGRIAFIDPVLDAGARTVKIRVNLINRENKLKPEMFVRARVDSRLSLSGKVVEPELAGKWISPMHPEVVKDGPGKCDVCGMPLVRAESLGYAPVGETQEDAPLVIPASAPLITGARAVVYVAVPDREGTFEGREIVLGPRAGPVYIVREGLRENERVVVNGAFKLDSDLQIQARPSMMNPQNSLLPEPRPAVQSPPPALSGVPAPGDDSPDLSRGNDVPAPFRAAIDNLADGYFEIQKNLSSDNLEKTRTAALDLLSRLAKTHNESRSLEPASLKTWKKIYEPLERDVHRVAKAGTLDMARIPFSPLSNAMRSVITTFASPKPSIHLFHCPMALDNQGAWWLQNDGQTRNPYFGVTMLLCKDVAEPLFREKTGKQ